MNEDQLKLFIDRHSIRSALLKHGAYSDEGNTAAMVELWAPDCSVEFPGVGLVQGRDAVLGRIGNALRSFRWTHHHLGDSTMEIDGDEASTMTPALCWHELNDGERCWVSLRYHHKLRREGDRWLITFRRVVLTGAEGSMTEYGWDWLERKLPPEAPQ
jgi:ketosteroid isomerase-like protein